MLASSRTSNVRCGSALRVFTLSISLKESFNKDVKLKQEEVERKDIVSGQVMEKDKLLRFVLAPDLTVVPDFKKKLPGRGIYVENSQKALQVAVAKNIFARASKQKAKVSPELVEMTENILRKKGLDAVSLARKAGILITGMDKVLDALKKAQVAFVLEASDAGDDGHNRVMLLAKNLEVFRLYDVEELDKALNKANTVHVAFTKSEMAKMVYNEFKRLANFLS